MISERHTPVMLAEVLAALDPCAGKLMIDGTFGAGGYSRAFLAAGARVLAFDRDPAVLSLADSLLPDNQFRFVNASFTMMADVAGECAADGVALDLGVSSMQLEEAERGFSFRRDGPLDMRMAQSGASAADLVNALPVDELVKIFREYGEERQAKRIAAAIARRRVEQPFTRTTDLADVVERALGGRRGAKIHPATRVFQALRISVNQELAQLEAGLAAAERTLKAGGCLAVVTFHSLEDRIVKTFLNERSATTDAGSRHAPPRAGGPPPSFSLLPGRARRAAPEEIGANPRARSAKMRGALRTDAAPWRLAA